MLSSCFVPIPVTLTRVLGTDTSFKLCNMWITDTFYCNKSLLSSTSRTNRVHLAPVMMFFTNDEETFKRFDVELISANSQLINLKNVRMKTEAAIFNRFQNVIYKLLQLCFMRHLQQGDEKVIDSYHQKSRNWAVPWRQST